MAYINKLYLSGMFHRYITPNTIIAINAEPPTTDPTIIPTDDESSSLVGVDVSHKGFPPFSLSKGLIEHINSVVVISC